MNLKKYKKPAADKTMTAGSLIVGGMVSSGIADSLDIITEDSKSQKAIVGIGGLLGAIAFSGGGNTKKILSNICLGMGVRQITRLIVEAGQDSLPEADGTTVNKFILDMFEVPNSTTVISKNKSLSGMGYRFVPERPKVEATAEAPKHIETSEIELNFPLT